MALSGATEDAYLLVPFVVLSLEVVLFVLGCTFVDDFSPDLLAVFVHPAAFSLPSGFMTAPWTERFPFLALLEVAMGPVPAGLSPGRMI
jgi:hypothetical protein